MSQNSSSGGNKKLTVSGLVVLALIALFSYFTGIDLLGTGDQSQTKAAPTATVQAQVQTESQSSQAATAIEVPSEGPVSGLPVVLWVELPPEAHDTIYLIDDGGPFPYDKDGSTFQNREGILPARANGYYAEYTVITPGSNDRGARRVVGGDDGELYYTDDHYDSFQEVAR
jgi:ribonuclease T1